MKNVMHKHVKCNISRSMINLQKKNVRKFAQTYRLAIYRYVCAYNILTKYLTILVSNISKRNKYN